MKLMREIAPFLPPMAHTRAVKLQLDIDEPRAFPQGEVGQLKP